VKKLILAVLLLLVMSALVGCDAGGNPSVVGNWELDRVENEQPGRAFTQRLEFYEDGSGARLRNPILGEGPFPFSWSIIEEGLMYMAGSGIFEFEIIGNEFRMFFDRDEDFYAVYVRVD